MLKHRGTGTFLGVRLLFRSSQWVPKLGYILESGNYVTQEALAGTSYQSVR